MWVFKPITTLLKALSGKENYSVAARISCVDDDRFASNVVTDELLSQLILLHSSPQKAAFQTETLVCAA
jgi:hypothetical protein